jgi:hypothetical protein
MRHWDSIPCFSSYFFVPLVSEQRRERKRGRERREERGERRGGGGRKKMWGGKNARVRF